MGYIDWLGKIEKEDSILVSILRRTGAVFYVKTSVPQTLMVCETVNNIIGRTINPRNKNWSCGGSSGGEGALIGIRGGIMGVGTDIGTLMPHTIMVGLCANAKLHRWFHPCSVCIQLPLWNPS